MNNSEIKISEKNSNKNMNTSNINNHKEDNLKLLLPKNHNEECFICLEEYNSEDEITILDCCKQRIHVKWVV